MTQSLSRKEFKFIDYWFWNVTHIYKNIKISLCKRGSSLTPLSWDHSHGSHPPSRPLGVLHCNCSRALHHTARCNCGKKERGNHLTNTHHDPLRSTITWTMTDYSDRLKLQKCADKGKYTHLEWRKHATLAFQLKIVNSIKVFTEQEMIFTHSVIVHTEQQRLEQLEHWRKHEEQARRSHWEHDVLDLWLFWHTQQHVGAAHTPTHPDMCAMEEHRAKIRNKVQQ